MSTPVNTTVNTLSSRPVTLTVNGRLVSLAVEPRTPLADFLRDGLDLTGTHLGCEHGVCGACTLLIDGEPARSCITFAAACEGATITTIEGLGTPAAPGLVQRAFIAEQAAQCGYCISAMIVSASALLAETPDPSDAQIRAALAGNLCRCGTHTRIIKAVRRAALELAGSAA